MGFLVWACGHRRRPQGAGGHPPHLQLQQIEYGLWVLLLAAPGTTKVDALTQASADIAFLINLYEDFLEGGEPCRVPFGHCFELLDFESSSIVSVPEVSHYPRNLLDYLFGHRQGLRLNRLH